MLNKKKFWMNDIDYSSCTTEILSNEMFSRMRMSHPLKPSATNSKKQIIDNGCNVTKSY